ncbi:Stk1 family PASTA domain-containing Ser/Thr kinase [Microbacterium lushaniae]|uniref:non-specific serine/threonine protein kinase n=1 Tax=Microbacterium lushaniae TaxID=2614639 RepID=A0A5J6L2P7_9MICO|nr:Stk1 family PASTA domain-containing Ser/Thr kinase [Microbacterium lushaniae]QEW02819.1 Stk1 family PASTA domain-containing Ser/Thr kinase [Microbacterium lushaniae]
MSTSQADPLIGRLVDGRYRVRARIARGGMATVYVATDLRLERRIALKVMHGHLSDDAVFQSRFIQEARAAARLADPHVVNVFDQGQDGDMAYLVMEYLPGITLRELLREHRRLTVPQTITIMDAVLSGLAAAHRAGIVHRDVKPENVLLAEDGRIKIGDFGLARATTANTASGQMLLGTIAYLAPELVTRGTADARSDIYALGIMLYEMLTGEQPYKGEQPMQIAFQHATDSVPRPSVKNPGVPEQLDELVLWATEKVPDDRPIDAAAMLDRLREIERDLGVAPQVARAVAVGTATADDVTDSAELTKVLPPSVVTSPAPPEESDNGARLRARTRRRAAKGGWLLVLVLLLAGLAGGAGWWFGSGPGSLVAVPDVTGGTFADAQARLLQDTLVAAEEGIHNLDVAAGTVVGTDPEPGTRVDRETTVTVLVSLGPRPQQVEPLAGMSAEQARGILTGINLLVSDPDAQEFTDAPAGSVLGATLTPRAGGDPTDCTQGCAALEGDTVSLLVSLGPVPDVTGDSVDRATERLSDAGLQVSGDRSSEYSNSIAEGDVIGILARDGGGNWRPGDTVQLLVSEGPRPIQVPDVVGRTVSEAFDILRDAGFEPGTALPELVWGLFTVSRTDPAAGTSHRPGTAVRVFATG